ncbi:4'-phosphopantetheinyl transferase family protein [Microbacterium sp. CJ88]|uniref:4'-phosphopantetheinyl transferase family protein n=1 Tax=Microbacterium sp. CJ88 TaxID=3445672 RepID=UPI003F657FF4
MIVTTRELGPVRLAWARAEAPDAETRALLATLGRAQRERWEAMQGARADAFATGRMLLARLSARAAPGSRLALTSVCPLCGEDHGPPRAHGAPLALSVAYAGSTVVAAVARTEEVRGLGVDVEPASDGPLPSLAGLFPDGAPDAAGWTRIEAVLKADGRGVRVAPDELRIDTEPGAVLPGAVCARVPTRDEAIEVVTIPGPPGHVVSAAVLPADR